MKRNVIGIVIALILVVGVVFVAMGSSSEGGKDITQAASGFTLKDQTGKEHSLSDYKGKVVVLNFWATWCPPCRRELPDFEKTYKDFKENSGDVVIMGIAAPNYGREVSSEEVIKFFEESGCTYPMLLDEDAAVFGEYAISGLPTTIIVDKNGKEVVRNTGVMSASELTVMINRVLDRD